MVPAPSGETFNASQYLRNVNIFENFRETFDIFENFREVFDIFENFREILKKRLISLKTFENF